MSLTHPLSYRAALAACALATVACGPGARSPGLGIGAIRAAVVTAGTGGPTITRIEVDATVGSWAHSIDLTKNVATGKYTGTFPAVPVGHVFLSAKAYTEDTDHNELEVGTGSTEVDVAQEDTATAVLTILDSSSRPPSADHGPIVTSVTAVSATPQVEETVTVTGVGVDPDGDALTYHWSDTCGGHFADVTATSTTWYSQTPGSCTLTFTATSRSIPTSLAIPLTVQGGSMAVELEFVPAPFVSSMTLVGEQFGGSGCTVERDDADATCRPAVTKPVSLTVNLAFDSVPVGSSTVSLTDDCGGSASRLSFLEGAGTASFTWTNANPTKATCRLTGAITRGSLSDQIVVGIGVEP